MRVGSTFMKHIRGFLKISGKNASEWVHFFMPGQKKGADKIRSQVCSTVVITCIEESMRWQYLPFSSIHLQADFLF